MISKVVGLLSSNDMHIATISSRQFKVNLANIAAVNNAVPVNNFISGQTLKGLYAYSYKSKSISEPDLLHNICKRISMFPIHKI